MWHRWDLSLGNTFPTQSFKEDSQFWINISCSVLLSSCFFVNTLIISLLLASCPRFSPPAAFTLPWHFPLSAVCGLRGIFRLSGREEKSAATWHLVTIKADVCWQLQDSCKDVNTKSYRCIFKVEAQAYISLKVLWSLMEFNIRFHMFLPLTRA